jgi:cation:H+ antiporter
VAKPGGSCPKGDMSQHAVNVILGIVLLAIGGVSFAFGAGQVARRCGAGPFAVGLIAAGLGTAAAALAFDLSAVARDRMRLAVGNIVGVNVANIGLVLGLAALVRPLAGVSRVVSAGIPTLIGATLLFCFVCRDGTLAPLGGAVLLLGFIPAVVYLSTVAKDEPDEVRTQFIEANAGPAWVGVLLIALGLVALIAGGAVAVTALGEIIKEQHLRSRAIGTTIMALATSLPGLLIAVLAARRGRSDLALGAVVGVCLFNVLLVAGITGLMAPVLSSEAAFLSDEHAVMNEIPVMAILSLLLLTVLFNGLEVPRWQGAILLAAYAGFIAWQVAGLK